MQTRSTFPQLSDNVSKGHKMPKPKGAKTTKPPRAPFGGVADGKSKMVPVPKHGNLLSRRAIAHKKAAESR